MGLFWLGIAVALLPSALLMGWRAWVTRAFDSEHGEQESNVRSFSRTAPLGPTG